MKYFVNLSSDYWVSKNALQEAYKQVAKKHNATLIRTKTDLQKWIDIFKGEIKSAEATHKRCKPMDLNIWQPEGRKQIISISNVFTIEIIAVQQEFLAATADQWEDQDADVHQPKGGAR